MHSPAQILPWLGRIYSLGVSGLSRRFREEVGRVLFEADVFPKGSNTLLEMLRSRTSVQIKPFLCFGVCIWGFPSHLRSVSERGRDS